MPAVALPARAGAGLIVHGEALALLRNLPDGCAGLMYADPPFNTGVHRAGFRLKTARDQAGARRGFAGARYRSDRTDVAGFADSFDDYVGWLRPRLVESRRVLAGHGTPYLHVDPRESHYCKVLLDEIFGRDCFLNEVIWAYDYGARSTTRWPAKHDVILVYARTAGAHHFDLSGVDRIPYMAPGLQTPERAARGKTPTDVWWHTIVPTNSGERTGYPTQKPLGVLRRIVAASSRVDDLVLDWCAGSGTTGVAAMELQRRFLLCDSSSDAVALMRRRLGGEVATLDLLRDGDATAGALQLSGSVDTVNGRIALVGSGEFTAATDGVDRALLEGTAGGVVFLPTAAALEGPERVAYWVDLGAAHYRRLGVAAAPLMVLDRATADSTELADKVAGAGLVYLSGGNPTYLATTLVGSRVGDAIVEAWRAGSSIAGCSAGAIALMEVVPDIRQRDDDVPGLAVVAGMRVIPHFNVIEHWMPGVVQRAIDRTPRGTMLVGIDEDTALVGGPDAWTVHGRGHAWVLGVEDQPVGYGAGAVLVASGVPGSSSSP